MAHRLKGKVAIVTGGASGIGQATCRLFAQEGAAVLIADLNESAGTALQSQLAQAGWNAWFHRLDVTHPDQWIVTMDAVLNRYGRLDVLVN